MKRFTIILALLLTSVAHANTPDGLGCCRFDFSDETVWTLSGHEGRRLDSVDGVMGTVLEITGDGTYSNAWTYKDFSFDAVCKKITERDIFEMENIGYRPQGTDERRLAMVRFKVRRTAGSGGAMTGPDFANHDVPVSEEWSTVSYTVMLPRHFPRGTLRLGQWMIRGTLQFAELEMYPVVARFDENGLSQEETLERQPMKYIFRATLGGNGYSRCVEDITARFNSDRWCFSGDSHVIYKFTVPWTMPDDHPLAAWNFRFNINYHTAGELFAEHSDDGENWAPLPLENPLGESVTASKPGVYVARVVLPPAAEKKDFPNFWEVEGRVYKSPKPMYIRLRAGEQANIQVNSVEYDATGAGLHYMFVGGGSGLGDHPSFGQSWFWEIRGGSVDFPGREISRLLRFAEKELPVDTGNREGDQPFTKMLDYKRSNKHYSLIVACDQTINQFYRTDYGYLLPGASADGCAVWWCESAYKIPRDRKVPDAPETVRPENAGVTLTAAGNDYESAQIVLAPQKDDFTLKTMTVQNLRSADGHEIPAENVTMRGEYYHFIENPTDSTCVRDFMPDALPPLEFPVQVKAGENTPLWLTVYVPAGTPAGVYTGEVKLHCGITKTLKIPLTVRVWGFNLPEKNTLETAFGFSPWRAFEYHGVKNDEDKRRVLDMYFTLLGKNRISPYNPAPLDAYRVKFIPDAENPEKSRAEVDFSHYEKAVEAAFEKYRFTGLMLQLPGMGGGTFQGQYRGKILDFLDDTPEYHAMFASMATQVEAFMEEKGWLDRAYVYWFDEPEEKDYAFVKAGMERIKRYAPKLRTMLTEEPTEAVLESDGLGKIDIWCPVSPHYNAELAARCRAEGETDWWYICCWPKAPYCTEFIDHPPLELRTWLWQTWQRDIRGVLIWDTNYWTSATAFPDAGKPQNPYADTMSYVSDGALPAGTRNFWGNGDGRFIYPPLSCQTPASEPNFDAPVSSIRLEMLREGVEDYEMLVLLRELVTALPEEKRADYEALLTVPDVISQSMTKFSTDPKDIYHQREKIAAAIEELTAAQDPAAALENAGAKVRLDANGNIIAVDARNTEITGATLGEMPFLRDLKLMGPQVTDTTLARLGGYQALTSLALDKTAITDETLINQVKKLPKLQQLFLAETAVTDAGVAALAENTGFTRVRLAGTKITDAALEILAGMPKLQSADLSNTAVTAAGVAKLAGLKNLADLNLYNAVNVAGCVTETLAAMPWLEKLNLDNVPVTDADVAKLAPMAENLTFLHLGGTKITDAAVPALTAFKKLATLHVNRTGVTEAGVKTLQAGLPDCEIITVGGEDRHP